MRAPMEITIPHVTTRANKDGSLRYYFFRRGQPLTRLPGAPNTTEFTAKYEECKNWVAPHIASYEGSFEAMCDDYMKSTAFTSKAKATRDARKRIILSMMKEPIDPAKPHRFGQEQFKRIGIAHLEVLRDRKADNPNAANERLKILSQVYKFAKVKPNPVRDIERLGVRQGGHETATDEDIAAYEAKHTSGPARLAMDILKHTGARVSDLRLLGLQHVRNGLISFTTVKTKMLCRLPLNGLELPRDRMTFVLTEDGAPFASDKALSQRVAKWFRQAGVKGVTAHSVRKWRATKMAEGGATENQLMAWFGWKDAKEARPYTQAADRLRMANEAGKTATIVQREPSNAV